MSNSNEEKRDHGKSGPGIKTKVANFVKNAVWGGSNNPKPDSQSDNAEYEYDAVRVKGAARRAEPAPERPRPKPFHETFPDAQQQRQPQPAGNAGFVSGRPGNVNPANMNAQYAPGNARHQSPPYPGPGPVAGGQLPFNAGAQQQRPHQPAGNAGFVSGRPGNVNPANMNAQYAPGNARHQSPPYNGPTAYAPPSNAYGAAAAAAAAKQNPSPVYPGPAVGANNQGYRGAVNADPRPEQHASGKREEDFECRRKRLVITGSGPDIRLQERQISFGEGSIQYWASQIPLFNYTKPSKPHVSLALEDLEFFIREVVRSGKKTTVQVVEEVAKSYAWDPPYRKPVYDIAFDALRDPAALQLALCLAQVEKSAQKSIQNQILSKIIARVTAAFHSCKWHSSLPLLQLGLQLTSDAPPQNEFQASLILQISDEAFTQWGQALNLAVEQILQAGISTETWQAFAMDDPIRPPPSDAEIDAALTMAVTLSLKLLCNMLDAAKILQQLSLCSQVIKLLEGGKITQLLAPPPPQRSRSVPIKTTFGQLALPCGELRLTVVKLVTQAVKIMPQGTGNKQLAVELRRSGVLEAIMELSVAFKLNDITLQKISRLVEQIITADCSGDSFNRELLYALWQNGRLCSRLAESCKKEPTQLLASPPFRSSIKAFATHIYNLLIDNVRKPHCAQLASYCRANRAELEELRQALIADAVNERRLLDSGYFVGDQRKAQDLEAKRGDPPAPSEEDGAAMAIPSDPERRIQWVDEKVIHYKNKFAEWTKAAVPLPELPSADQLPPPYKPPVRATSIEPSAPPLKSLSDRSYTEKEEQQQVRNHPHQAGEPPKQPISLDVRPTRLVAVAQASPPNVEPGFPPTAPAHEIFPSSPRNAAPGDGSSGANITAAPSAASNSTARASSKARQAVGSGNGASSVGNTGKFVYYDPDEDNIEQLPEPLPSRSGATDSHPSPHVSTPADSFNASAKAQTGEPSEAAASGNSRSAVQAPGDAGASSSKRDTQPQPRQEPSPTVTESVTGATGAASSKQDTKPPQEQSPAVAAAGPSPSKWHTKPGQDPWPAVAEPVTVAAAIPVPGIVSGGALGSHPLPNQFASRVAAVELESDAGWQVLNPADGLNIPPAPAPGSEPGDKPVPMDCDENN